MLLMARRRCDTLFTTGFVDDIIFFYNGPYSGVTFAAKDGFHLNLLTCRRIGHKEL